MNEQGGCSFDQMHIIHDIASNPPRFDCLQSLVLSLWETTGNSNVRKLAIIYNQLTKPLNNRLDCLFGSWSFVFLLSRGRWGPLSIQAHFRALGQDDDSIYDPTPVIRVYWQFKDSRNPKTREVFENCASQMIRAPLHPLACHQVGRSRSTWQCHLLDRRCILQ